MFSTPKQSYSEKNVPASPEMSQSGKSFDDMLPYLLSGESDELSSEVIS